MKSHTTTEPSKAMATKCRCCDAPATTALDVMAPDGKTMQVPFCEAHAALMHADVTVTGSGAVRTFRMHSRKVRPWLDEYIGIPAWVGPVSVFQAARPMADAIQAAMIDAGFVVSCRPGGAA